MKLIVGLGNPGSQYVDTRHNAGFLALDHLAKAWGAGAFTQDAKRFTSLAKANSGDETVLLAKPATFMNESGRAVAGLLAFYKLTPADLLVLHDDMDIASGTFRSTSSSRAAGHNGVADLIEKLGTPALARLRIGIGRPEDVLGACQPGHDYVLGRFTDTEQEALDKLFPALEKEARAFLEHTKTALS